MREEARLILGEAVGAEAETRDVASIIRSYFGPTNGVDLELPPRSGSREPRPVPDPASFRKPSVLT